ncbi:MAG: methyltransferase domain-containing protein [Pirellulaceae bacterium]|nr:methyltransferase domain-containing protein [Pirellulaceae bacterium]
MFRPIARLILCLFLSLATVTPLGFAQPSAPPAAKAKPRAKEDSQQRDKSLQKLAELCGAGAGSVIADIGAGAGRDSWTFAQIVGPSGKVYSVEIEKNKVDTIAKEAANRKLTQVEPVLGKTDDPCLPAASVDMAFMHLVYHHVTQPNEMLQGIWRALKPGGRLVIVDQRLGTLMDWVPREDRGPKHFWIAETTVVREARENGYAFVQYAEDRWHANNVFVLVFQRPEGLESPSRDPDTMPTISAETLPQLLPPAGQTFGRVAFVALGEGRKLIDPFLKANPCQSIDIVLEEWATQKDERPALPTGVEMPSVLTDRGDPKLGPDPLDAVYFLDTYHLLFHGPVLLSKLRERLKDSGQVYIVDRQAPAAIPHREASHRRMIAAETVKQQMNEAGFTFLREGAAPAECRFLLIFQK